MSSESVMKKESEICIFYCFILFWPLSSGIYEQNLGQYFIEKIRKDTAPNLNILWSLWIYVKIGWYVQKEMQFYLVK